MLDPLSLYPLALAAHAGRVDEFEAQQLIAAGLTLLQRSAPLVRALSGRRAAILLPTSPAFLVALGACEGRGAVLVNPLAAPREVAYQIADAKAGAVFTIESLADRVPDGVPLVLLDEAPRRARVSVASVVRDVDLGSHVGLSLEGDPDAAGSDDEAVIVYTSAMAGRPLGAILSHRNLLINARATIEATRLNENDRLLALLPFAHLFGLTGTCGAPLLAGGDVFTMARFNPSHAVDAIANRGITAVLGVPAVFRALLSVLERREEPAMPTLRLSVCGGAPLSPALQDRWFDVTGTELRQGYGLTEAGPVCLFNRVNRPNARGTLGLPLPGVDVELREPVEYDGAGMPVDRSDRESPERRNAGEICVRGDNLFRGYVSNGSAGLPIRDGWLHTGDLGRRAGNGTIAFTSFLKPMITRNGFNVYPREIEHAVRELPGVVSVVARAVERPEAEPDIEIDVVGSASVADIKAWCEERLSAYKQPSAIQVRA